VSESPSAVFDRLVAAGPPERAEVLFGTACVLGGSIAGLLAARVLADHAERVVVIERDAADGDGHPRAGVAHRQHLHGLVPCGREWMERWLPGFTREMHDAGAALSRPEQVVFSQDGYALIPGSHYYLTSSRTFLEDAIRARVLALRNVSVLRARATGLEYRGDEVRAVRYQSDGIPGELPADLVVDAMGRASRLSDWLFADGFDRPVPQRLPTVINYTTALFKRAQRPEELPVALSVARYNPPYPADGVAVAGVCAIEGNQWLLTLVGYDDARPGRTLDALRAACAQLPPLYREVASHDLAEPIAVYQLAESRRRDFAGLGHFPARLVSVGDAVASFNPIYAQGMSAAALHASCLSEYLSTRPDLRSPAAMFFELQRVVTDAAWAVSAGGDAARLDARSGAEVPAEVSRQRWAMDQLLHAALVDADVCRAVQNVLIEMLAHPSTLADPALLERAVTASQRGQVSPYSVERPPS
jgi:2-polyprenyl-6-methoxyphenol hydroxylase-like FAD-dependent oxidoreductase